LYVPCPYCDYKGLTCKAMLEEHIEKKHPEEQAYLSLQTRSRSANAGARRPRKAGYIPCPFEDTCDYLARRKDFLDRHIQKKHQPTSQPNDSQNATTKVECHKCKRQLDLKDALDLHNKMEHSNEPTLRCFHISCDFTTNTQDSLESHIKSVHETFKCPMKYCLHIANSEKMLKYHMEHIHPPNDPNVGPKFICNETNCEARFLTQKDLDAHHDKEHKKMPYQCTSSPDCNYSTSTADILADHINSKHTHAITYKCTSSPDCTFVTYSKMIYTTHQLVDH